MLILAMQCSCKQRGVLNADFLSAFLSVSPSFEKKRQKDQYIYKDHQAGVNLKLRKKLLNV